MKSPQFPRLSLLLGLSLLALILLNYGCKEHGPAPLPKGFSDEILSIIPQETIDSLESIGLNIYSGFNPPDIEGVYLISPFVLKVPYGPDDQFQVGHQFADYKYRFREFSLEDLTVRVDYKNLPTPVDTATGVAGFLSGDGNGFTLFTELEAETRGVRNTQVAIITGVKTEEGIRNFQYGFYIKSKDEAPGIGQLIPLGTGRVVEDEDSLSVRVNSWDRFAAPAGKGFKSPLEAK